MEYSHQDYPPAGTSPPTLQAIIAHSFAFTSCFHQISVHNCRSQLAASCIEKFQNNVQQRLRSTDVPREHDVGKTWKQTLLTKPPHGHSGPNLAFHDCAPRPQTLRSNVAGGDSALPDDEVRTHSQAPHQVNERGGHTPRDLEFSQFPRSLDFARCKDDRRLILHQGIMYQFCHSVQLGLAPGIFCKQFRDPDLKWNHTRR